MQHHHHRKPKNLNSYEFVGRFPASTLDLRGTAHVCGCSALAVCEKAGRTVCRACADKLTGQEYPLRSGRWHRGTGILELRDQLSGVIG